MDHDIEALRLCRWLEVPAEFLELSANHVVLVSAFCVAGLLTSETDLVRDIQELKLVRCARQFKDMSHPDPSCFRVRWPIHDDGQPIPQYVGDMRANRVAETWNQSNINGDRLKLLLVELRHPLILSDHDGAGRREMFAQSGFARGYFAAQHVPNGCMFTH